MDLNQPPQPPAAERKKGGWSALISVVLFVVSLIGLLYAAPLGKFGQFVMIGAIVFAAVLGLHYFVWGWWLPKVLEKERSESESESAD